METKTAPEDHKRKGMLIKMGMGTLKKHMSYIFLVKKLYPKLPHSFGHFFVYSFKFSGFYISFLLMLTTLQSITCAHGVIYDIKNENNKYVINLKLMENSSKKGINITHFNMSNGRVLNVGYELKEGYQKNVSFQYPLEEQLPFKVKPVDINNISWLPFKDISGIESEEYIRHLHDAGIVNGMTDGSFKPDSQITRAEFMVFVVKALKLEVNISDSKKYTDIHNHWGKNIILSASDYGLISGYKDGTVKPDKPITLAEVCSIVDRAFKFKTVKNGIYPKLQDGKWYSSSVKKMFDLGILKLNDSIYSKFNEEAYVKRGDCSIIISRALITY